MKKVNLFSGGLDSFIVAKLFAPDVNLYIDVGESYSEKQLALLDTLPVENVITRAGPWLQEFVSADGVYLRHRNALFILLAAYYGDEILVGSTVGDAYPDKSVDFRQAMENALNVSYGMDIYVVSSPLANMTKNEVVALYRKTGMPMSDLDKTSSCYHPTEHECMECGSCLRRLVAFAMSGHREDELTDHVSKVWGLINDGKWSGSVRENEQTIKFLVSRKMAR